MSIKELFQDYIDGKATGYETIATLTGIIDTKHAIVALAMVNQLARLESGQMDRETFIAVYKLDVK